MLTTKKSKEGYEIINNGSVLTTIKAKLSQEDLDKIYQLFVDAENAVKARVTKEVSLSIVGVINNQYLYR